MALATADIIIPDNDDVVRRGRPRKQAHSAVVFDNMIVRKLVEEQKRQEQAFQVARSLNHDKIIFHFKRGMSVASLERTFGRDAVTQALDSIKADRGMLSAVSDMNYGEIAQANARNKRRMGAR